MRLEGFEPPTLGSEDRCSIPLSYSRSATNDFASLTLVVNSKARSEPPRSATGVKAPRHFPVNNLYESASFR